MDDFIRGVIENDLLDNTLYALEVNKHSLSQF